MTDYSDLIERLSAFATQADSKRAAAVIEMQGEELDRYRECLQDARDFIATTLAGIGDGHRIAELVADFDYLLKGEWND